MRLLRLAEAQLAKTCLKQRIVSSSGLAGTGSMYREQLEDEKILVLDTSRRLQSGQHDRVI